MKMKREQTYQHPSDVAHDNESRTAEPADEHIGATEDQVTDTTPPDPEDDEPKQG